MSDGGAAAVAAKPAEWDTESVAESLAPDDQEGFETSEGGSELEPGKDEDFSDVERYDILSNAGTDTQGNPVFCFKSANMPTDPKMDFRKLLRYMKLRMDPLVDSDYSIVYLHHGLSSKNKPPVSWLRKVYGSFDRKYKKNLKSLYLVHTTSFIKVVLTLFKPLLSKKFSKKIHFLKQLAELDGIVSVQKLQVPIPVKRHDDQLKLKANASARGKKGEPEVFGARLAEMAVDDGGLPPVFRQAMDLIRNDGLDTEGIFRRSVSHATLKTVKQLFNDGDAVDLAEYNDPQLAAALMKGFFRELAEPLLTFELYSSFLEFMAAGDLDAQVAACKAVVGQLPVRNLQVLQELLAFLSEVSEHEEANKMGVNNLAIVFGPNILRTEDEAAGFLSTGKCNDAVRFLIENRPALF